MIAVKKFLDNIEKYIIYVVLTVLVTLMFGQVVARYVFGLAWGWMEQLTRLLFVYVTFAGMSYACRKSEHLRVSFLAEFLPGKYSRTILFLIGYIRMAVVSAYLCYRIFNMMLLCYQQKQVFSGATFIPVWVMYLAGVLGMGGMAIRTLQFGIIPALRSFSGSTEESYGDKELSAKGTGE